jgi:hypothetical protein
LTTLIESGRVVVTDSTVGGDPTVLDTNERMFHGTNGLISGTLYVPTRTATRFVTSGGTSHALVDVSDNTVLASIHSLANTVRGQIYVTEPSGSAHGITNFGWFDASGSYIHYLGPNNAASGASGNVSMTSIASYTFLATGGQLIFNERCILHAPRNTANGTYTRTLPGPTIQYNLYVGAFT